MAKELTNEEVQELAKKLQKTDKVFEKVADVEALEDEDMEEVSGTLFAADCDGHLYETP